MRFVQAFVALFSVVYPHFATSKSTALPEQKHASRGQASTISTRLKTFDLQEKGLRQSIFVLRLSDGAVLFAHDENQNLNPASVSKVLSAAAFLDYFGPSHRLKTKVFYSGKRQGGRIDGDLVLVGDGDPLLVSEKLWQTAADLRHLGISEISGDLLIDDTLFDQESRDDQRSSGKEGSTHAYDAPITSLGINFNNFAIAVSPGPSVGSLARVEADPYDLPDLAIENTLRTVKAGAGNKISISRRSVGENKAIIAVSGTVASDSDLKKVYRSVGNPIVSSGEIFLKFLEHEGIILSGKIRKGQGKAPLALLHEIESDTMAEMIFGLNQFSNNFIADVLTKRLGAAFMRRGEKLLAGSGNFANGTAAISAFLRSKVKITTPFNLENGSGLSLENRVSAKQVVEVLRYVAKRPEIYPEFLASLPVAARSGSLEKRFTTPAFRALSGLIRAKTGTLSEPIIVSGLAGYLEHPKHKTLAFCILQNGKAGMEQQSLTRLHAIQENGLLALLH